MPPGIGYSPGQITGADIMRQIEMTRRGLTGRQAFNPADAMRDQIMNDVAAAQGTAGPQLPNQSMAYAPNVEPQIPQPQPNQAGPPSVTPTADTLPAPAGAGGETALMGQEPAGDVTQIPAETAATADAVGEATGEGGFFGFLKGLFGGLAGLLRHPLGTLENWTLGDEDLAMANARREKGGLEPISMEEMEARNLRYGGNPIQDATWELQPTPQELYKQRLEADSANRLSEYKRRRDIDRQFQPDPMEEARIEAIKRRSQILVNDAMTPKSIETTQELPSIGSLRPEFEASAGYGTEGGFFDEDSVGPYEPEERGWLSRKFGWGGEQDQEMADAVARREVLVNQAMIRHPEIVEFLAQGNGETVYQNMLQSGELMKPGDGGLIPMSPMEVASAVVGRIVQIFENQKQTEMTEPGIGEYDAAMEQIFGPDWLTR